MLQNKCIGTAADDDVCYNLSVVCVRVHTCRINAQEATPTYALFLCGAYGLQCRTGPLCLTMSKLYHFRHKVLELPSYTAIHTIYFIFIMKSYSEGTRKNK